VSWDLGATTVGDGRENVSTIGYGFSGIYTFLSCIIVPHVMCLTGIPWLSVMDNSNTDPTSSYIMERVCLQ
jgi:hypothetical protein